MIRFLIRLCLVVTFALGIAGCDGSDGFCSGFDCQCPAGQACSFDCDDGPGCDQQCQGECALSCEQGNCDQQCSAGSDCTASCAGGNCDQQCSPGAVCTFSCEGGNCEQACLNNPDCTVSCSGGNCEDDQF